MRAAGDCQRHYSNEQLSDHVGDTLRRSKSPRVPASRAAQGARIQLCLPGWLVLLPRRHVTSVAELTDAEASSLGTWQVRLSRALHHVLGCEKTYIAQFGEAEGFAHVHFHIVPRPAGLASDERGPGIFARMLGPADRPHVGEQQMNEIAAKLVRELAD